jgi:hypothetical protein
VTFRLADSLLSAVVSALVIWKMIRSPGWFDRRCRPSMGELRRLPASFLMRNQARPQVELLAVFAFVRAGIVNR